MSTTLAFIFGLTCGWLLAWRSVAVARASWESRALAERLRVLVARLGPPE